MHNKYRIIIWGAGDIAREVIRRKNDEVVVLGFLDNNPAIKEFEGLQALEKKQIHEEDYDYIVICSRSYKEIYSQLLSMGVNSEKILDNPIPKVELYSVYQYDLFAKKWNTLLQSGKKDIYISGISYHNDGIDDSVFGEMIGKEAFNLANRAQDIFYDYQIAKLLDNENLLQNTTHYIVGLCYYSFDYDLSKSSSSWEIIRYYPYIKEQHNLASAGSFETFVCKTKEYIEKNKIYYCLFNKDISYIVNGEAGLKMAQMDFNKDHPITVWENKEILKQFIAFLKDRSIKPVIVIMPAVEGYVKGCPETLKQRFYDSLLECVEGMDVQILDYFGKYYADISDYYHVSHFNHKGAVKFTKRLIQDIIW